MVDTSAFQLPVQDLACHVSCHTTANVFILTSRENDATRHIPQTVVINRSQMIVYLEGLLILTQHVAAQLQTRHLECEKFLFKVVLLSSASIARANRFGSGRLC